MKNQNINQMDLVSVVIPIYNGEKYIDKRMKDILNQSYRNIEVILVPNNCSDRSVEKCFAWAEKDQRVKVFVNPEKGTSLARKRGVLESKGKYILFSDQDDYYINRYAIEKMHQAIVEDQAQIVQFGSFTEYLPHIRRVKYCSDKSMVFGRDEIMQGPLMGAIVGRGGLFSGSVWSKIYEGEMLREAVNDIQYPLFHQEDTYMNLCAFTNINSKRYSTRREAYYVWKAGIGFSGSSNVDRTICREYEFLKPFIIKRLDEIGAAPKIYLRIYSEALWCYRATLNRMIMDNNMSEQEILDFINEIEAFKYIRMTKDYFLSHPENVWHEEMKFMISDYTLEEYLAFCKAHLPKPTMKSRVVKVLKNFRPKH